jgi:hypothetical protein
MVEKYLVEWGTGPSRTLTLSEINAAITAGEISPESLFWQEGRPHWEPLNTLFGVTARAPANGNKKAGVVSAPASSPAGDSAKGFWEQQGVPSYISLWSTVSYTFVALLFTPLTGSILIYQNHRVTGERAWRLLPVFWMVVWGIAILAVLADRIFRGFAYWPYWVAIAGVLWFFWFFTCALPHRAYLHTLAKLEIYWRTDFGKPLGFSFFVLVACAILMLLV